jgi:hypothetical protein
MNCFCNAVDSKFLFTSHPGIDIFEGLWPELWSRGGAQIFQKSRSNIKVLGAGRGDMKQVPYRGATNIWLHLTKCLRSGDLAHAIFTPLVWFLRRRVVNRKNACTMSGARCSDFGAVLSPHCWTYWNRWESHWEFWNHVLLGFWIHFSAKNSCSAATEITCFLLCPKDHYCVYKNASEGISPEPVASSRVTLRFFSVFCPLPLGLKYAFSP